MTYFIKNQEIDQVPCMSLFYDFKVALDNEDYKVCQEIKEEFDRRDKLGKIDRVFMKALLHFFNHYSNEVCTFNKKHFNNFFIKYI